MSWINVGSFSPEGIIVVRDPRLSSLGLDFLRRYLLTEFSFNRSSGRATPYTESGLRREFDDFRV